jgi:dsRNA-specific ribonuclease
MATQVLSQPEWVSNPQLLQRKIVSIIGRIMDPSHINALLDETALRQYWAVAFTHKSVDANNNYETFEFYGDKVMNYAFAMHIRKRFEDKLNQAKGTLLMNQYMSETFQAQLAECLGLPEYVRFDPQVPDINTKIKEDITEAFFGCLNNLANDRIEPEGSMGYPYCYNLLNVIMNQIPISLESVQKDPVTQLKELFEKLAWGAPSYVQRNSDDPSRGPVKTEVRAATTGELLGIGYGTQDEARFQASAAALKKLADQGITVEYADREKMERQRIRNPEFDRQYRRVQTAIAKLNETARQYNKVPIVEFKISQIESHKVPGGGTRTTYAIEVAYQGADGKLIWRRINQMTGNDNDQTKIAVMKDFADKYKVPAEL